MANAFNLTAQINLRGPTNLKPIVADIRRQLGSISANVNLNLDAKSAKGIEAVTNRLTAMNTILAQAKSNADGLASTLQGLSNSLSSVQQNSSNVSSSIGGVSASAATSSKNIAKASSAMAEFGKQSALAVKRFAAFSFVTTGVFALINAVNSATKAFIDFDKQTITLQQVTGKGAIGIRALTTEITRLATTYGVSSATLIEAATTLAQAGLSASETRTALEALAKTELAPSFDDMTQTTEGVIAAMRQFGLEAKDLDAALGSINAVSAAFAVEASDIIAAIQRTGGVFASASHGVSEGTDALNEFIAVFTSVRATTRESAETIATGLRTIFTRIQRASTIDALKEFGIELQDLDGKFVGPYEAIKRLSEGLKMLDTRDIRFSGIVEELGGFRQIGKVIPLIQQFSTAQEALKVAQSGQASTAKDAVIAQQSLANQIAKVREQFLALVRDVGQSSTFQGFFTIVTKLAGGLISLASAFKPILPLLAIMGAVKGFNAITQFAGGFASSFSKGGGAQAAGQNIGSSLTGSKDKEKADATSKAADAIISNTNALTTLTSTISVLTTHINSLSAAVNTNTSTIRASSGGGTGTGGTTLNKGGPVRKLATGGTIQRFASGGTIPALVSNGEGWIPPNEVASFGGYKTLDKLNQADRNGMGKYSIGGGVGIFKGPGSGTSDNIRTNLAVGGYVLRASAMKALGFNKGGSVGVRKFAKGSMGGVKNDTAEFSIDDILTRSGGATIKEALKYTNIESGKLGDTASATINSVPVSLDPTDYRRIWDIAQEKAAASKGKYKTYAGIDVSQENRNLLRQISTSPSRSRKKGKTSGFSNVGQLLSAEGRWGKAYEQVLTEKLEGNWESASGISSYPVDLVRKLKDESVASIGEAKFRSVPTDEIDLVSKVLRYRIDKKTTEDYFTEKTNKDRDTSPDTNVGVLDYFWANDQKSKFYDWIQEQQKQKITGFNRGGLVQKFAIGGKTTRRIGIIDSDVLRQTSNAEKVSEGMKSIGSDSITDYTIQLAKLAVQRRKSDNLKKFRVIAGAAGSGKSSLATGVSANDSATLRETVRSHILTPQDLDNVDEVLTITANVSDAKLEGYLRDADRTYTVSSSTKEEQDLIKRNKESRDITGQGLYGREPGKTSGVSTDFGIEEATLMDELGSKNIVLGRKKDGEGNLTNRFRRKRGDELPEIVQAEGYYTGGFAPPTRGHRGAFDTLLANVLAKKPNATLKDILVSVAPNVAMVEGKEGLEHAARYGIFDADFRSLLADVNFKGAMISQDAQSTPGILPKVMEVPGENNRRKFARLKGAMAITSGKEKGVLGKYDRAGIQVTDIPRIEDISATKVRELLFSQNYPELDKIVNPEVGAILKGNQPQLKNRSVMVPVLLEEINKAAKTNAELANKQADDILQNAPGGPYRNVSKELRAQHPEIAAQIEKIRAQRDAFKKSASGAKAHDIIRQLASSYPEIYGIDPSRRVATAATSISAEEARSHLGDRVQSLLPEGTATPEASLLESIRQNVTKQLAVPKGAGTLPTDSKTITSSFLNARIPADPTFGMFSGKTIDPGIVKKVWRQTYPGLSEDKTASYTAVKEWLQAQYNARTGAKTEELSQAIQESKMVGLVGMLPIGHERLSGPFTWMLGKNAAGEDVSVTASIIERGLGKKYEEEIRAAQKHAEQGSESLASGLAAKMKKRPESLRSLDKDQLETLGQGNIEGAYVEQALARLWANLDNVSTRTRPIDYPDGLGESAELFPGISPTMPTEVKRTINSDSRSDAIEEFQRYFRLINGIPEPKAKKEVVQALAAGGEVQKLMAGGATKTRKPKEIFGTGETTFPSRISKKYAEEQHSASESLRAKLAWDKYPKDERIMVNEDKVQEAYQQPFDRDRFTSSFKEKISRDSLFERMSDFAKFVGLPQEDLSLALPLQLDFGASSRGGGLGMFSAAEFSKGAAGIRPYEGYDLSTSGYGEKEKQESYGLEKLIAAKEKEIKKIKKTPTKTFDDGSFSFDSEAFQKTYIELDNLKNRWFKLKDLKRDAEKAALSEQNAVSSATGRGSISFAPSMGYTSTTQNHSLYHEMTHQLFEGLRTRSAESFTKYRDRVSSLFSGDNDDLADAFDSLTAVTAGGGYTSADVVYGRSYKSNNLSQILSSYYRQNLDSSRGATPIPEDITKNLASLSTQSTAAKRAREYRPINPQVNEALLQGGAKFGMTQEKINRMEDNGKEEFLTTLIEKAPQLDQNLQGILDSTLTELLSGAGIQRQKFAVGGKASRGVDLDKEFMANPVPSPFNKVVSKKLGPEVYDLEKSSGLSSFEFDETKRLGDAAGDNFEQFRKRVAERAEAKKQRSQIKTNSSALLQQLTPQGRTSSPKQLALAEQLKGEPDAGYRPILTEAQRTAANRSAIRGSALEDINNATRQFAAGGEVEGSSDLSNWENVQQDSNFQQAVADFEKLYGRNNVMNKLQFDAYDKDNSKTPKIGMDQGLSGASYKVTPGMIEKKGAEYQDIIANRVAGYRKANKVQQSAIEKNKIKSLVEQNIENLPFDRDARVQKALEAQGKSMREYESRPRETDYAQGGFKIRAFATGGATQLTPPPPPYPPKKPDPNAPVKAIYQDKEMDAIKKKWPIGTKIASGEWKLPGHRSIGVGQFAGENKELTDFGGSGWKMRVDPKTDNDNILIADWFLKNKSLFSGYKIATNTDHPVWSAYVSRGTGPEIQKAAQKAQSDLGKFITLNQAYDTTDTMIPGTGISGRFEIRGDERSGTPRAEEIVNAINERRKATTKYKNFYLQYKNSPGFSKGFPSSTSGDRGVPGTSYFQWLLQMKKDARRGTNPERAKELQAAQDEEIKIIESVLKEKTPEYSFNSQKSSSNPRTALAPPPPPPLKNFAVNPKTRLAPPPPPPAPPKKFAIGGTIPALVSNGEGWVPPEQVASFGGYGALDLMNQADRNGMGRYSEGGGIGVFKGPGSGTSDSIKTNLAVGGYVLRAGAMEALGFNKGGAVGVRKFAKGSPGGVGGTTQTGTQDKQKDPLIAKIQDLIQSITKLKATIGAPKADKAKNDLEEIIGKLGLGTSSNEQATSEVKNIVQIIKAAMPPKKNQAASLENVQAASASIPQKSETESVARDAESTPRVREQNNEERLGSLKEKLEKEAKEQGKDLLAYLKEQRAALEAAASTATTPTTPTTPAAPSAPEVAPSATATEASSEAAPSVPATETVAPIDTSEQEKELENLLEDIKTIQKKLNELSEEKRKLQTPKLDSKELDRQIEEAKQKLDTAYAVYGGGEGPQAVRRGKHKASPATSGDEIISRYEKSNPTLSKGGLSEEEIEYFKGMSSEEAQKYSLKENIAYGGAYSVKGGMLNARRSGRTNTQYDDLSIAELNRKASGMTGPGKMDQNLKAIQEADAKLDELIDKKFNLQIDSDEAKGKIEDIDKELAALRQSMNNTVSQAEAVKKSIDSVKPEVGTPTNPLFSDEDKERFAREDDERRASSSSGGSVPPGGGSVPPGGGSVPPGGDGGGPTPEDLDALISKETKDRNAYNDNQFFEYKGRKEGTTAKAYKLDIARKLGTATYEAKENFAGRKQEMSYELAGRQDSLTSLQSSLKAATEAGNTSEVGLIKDRIHKEVETLANEMKTLKPSITNASQAAKKMVDAMMAGNLKKAQEELISTLGEAPDSAEAMDMAMEQLAKQLGISKDILERNFGENGSEAKEVKRQTFINSREGQRYGALAQYAPDMLSKFSGTRTGKALGSGADFISGKGGKFSQLFSKMGGLTTIGASLSVAAEKFQKSVTITNPNTAGIVGGIGGAGSGLASGAALGAQVAGPVGALIAGISGAIIGGITGAFDAFNAKRLENNIKAVENSASDLNTALKKLAENASETNAALVDSKSTKLLQDSGDLREQANLGRGGMARSAVEFLRAYDPTGISNSVTGGTVEKEARDAFVGQTLVPYIDAQSNLGDVRRNKISTEQLQEVRTRIDDRTKAAAATKDPAEMAKAEKLNQEELLKSSQTVRQLIAPVSEGGKGHSLDEALITMGVTQRKKEGRDYETDSKTAEGRAKLREEGAKLAAQEEDSKNRTLLLSRAMREMSIETDHLIETYRRAGAYITRFGDELEAFDAQLNNNINALRGQASVGPVDRSNEKILGNLSGYSDEEVKGAADRVAQLAGGGKAGAELGQQVQMNKVLQDKLPQILKGATSENINEGDNSVMSQIKEALSVVGEPPKALLDEIEAKLRDKTGGREGGTSLSDIGDDTGGFVNSIKAAQAATNLSIALEKQYSDALQKTIGYQNEYGKALQEASDYQMQAQDVRLKGEVQLKEALGQRMSLDEVNAPQEARIKGLTSSVVQGGTTDPGKILEAMQRDIASKPNNERDLEAKRQAYAASGAEPDKAAFEAQARLVAAQNNSINNSRKALEELAKDSTGAANALKGLAEQQKIAQGGVNFIQKVLTSDADQLAEMDRSLQAYTKVITGKASNQELDSVKFRQQAFGGLSEISSMMPDPLKNQMQATLIENMAASSPRLSKILDTQTGGTFFNEKTKQYEPMTYRSQLNMVKTGKDPIQQQYIDAYKEATAKQADAADRLGEAAQKVADKLLKGMTDVLGQIKDKLSTAVDRAVVDTTTPQVAPAAPVVDPTLVYSIDPEDIQDMKDALNIENIPLIWPKGADTSVNALTANIAALTVAIAALSGAVIGLGALGAFKNVPGLNRIPGFGGGAGGGRVDANGVSRDASGRRTRGSGKGGKPKSTPAGGAPAGGAPAGGAPAGGAPAGGAPAGGAPAGKPSGRPGGSRPTGRPGARRPARGGKGGWGSVLATGAQILIPAAVSYGAASYASQSLIPPTEGPTGPEKSDQNNNIPEDAFNISEAIINVQMATINIGNISEGATPEEVFGSSTPQQPALPKVKTETTSASTEEGLSEAALDQETQQQPSVTQMAMDMGAGIALPMVAVAGVDQAIKRGVLQEGAEAATGAATKTTAGAAAKTTAEAAAKTAAATATKGTAGGILSKLTSFVPKKGLGPKGSIASMIGLTALDAGVEAFGGQEEVFGREGGQVYGTGRNLAGAALSFNPIMNAINLAVDSIRTPFNLLTDYKGTTEGYDLAGEQTLYDMGVKSEMLGGGAVGNTLGYLWQSVDEAAAAFQAPVEGVTKLLRGGTQAIGQTYSNVQQSAKIDQTLEDSKKTNTYGLDFSELARAKDEASLKVRLSEAQKTGDTKEAARLEQEIKSGQSARVKARTGENYLPNWMTGAGQDSDAYKKAVADLQQQDQFRQGVIGATTANAKPVVEQQAVLPQAQATAPTAQVSPKVQAEPVDAPLEDSVELSGGEGISFNDVAQGMLSGILPLPEMNSTDILQASAEGITNLQDLLPDFSMINDTGLSLLGDMNSSLEKILVALENTTGLGVQSVSSMPGAGLIQGLPAEIMSLMDQKNFSDSDKDMFSRIFEGISANIPGVGGGGAFSIPPEAVKELSGITGKGSDIITSAMDLFKRAKTGGDSDLSSMMMNNAPQADIIKYIQSGLDSLANPKPTTTGTPQEHKTYETNVGELESAIKQLEQTAASLRIKNDIPGGPSERDRAELVRTEKELENKKDILEGQKKLKPGPLTTISLTSEQKTLAEESKSLLQKLYLGLKKNLQISASSSQAAIQAATQGASQNKIVATGTTTSPTMYGPALSPPSTNPLDTTSAEQDRARIQLGESYSQSSNLGVGANPIAESSSSTISSPSSVVTGPTESFADRNKRRALEDAMPFYEKEIREGRTPFGNDGQPIDIVKKREELARLKEPLLANVTPEQKKRNISNKYHALADAMPFYEKEIAEGRTPLDSKGQPIDIEQKRSELKTLEQQRLDNMSPAQKASRQKYLNKMAQNKAFGALTTASNDVENLEREHADSLGMSYGDLLADKEKIGTFRQSEKYKEAKQKEADARLAYRGVKDLPTVGDDFDKSGHRKNTGYEAMMAGRRQAYLAGLKPEVREKMMTKAEKSARALAQAQVEIKQNNGPSLFDPAVSGQFSSVQNKPLQQAEVKAKEQQAVDNAQFVADNRKHLSMKDHAESSDAAGPDAYLVNEYMAGGKNANGETIVKSEEELNPEQKERYRKAKAKQEAFLADRIRRKQGAQSPQQVAQTQQQTQQATKPAVGASGSVASSVPDTTLESDRKAYEDEKQALEEKSLNAARAATEADSQAYHADSEYRSAQQYTTEEQDRGLHHGYVIKPGETEEQAKSERDRLQKQRNERIAAAKKKKEDADQKANEAQTAKRYASDDLFLWNRDNKGRSDSLAQREEAESKRVQAEANVAANSGTSAPSSPAEAQAAAGSVTTPISSTSANSQQQQNPQLARRMAYLGRFNPKAREAIIKKLPKAEQEAIRAADQASQQQQQITAGSQSPAVPDQSQPIASASPSSTILPSSGPIPTAAPMQQNAQQQGLPVGPQGVAYSIILEESSKQFLASFAETLNSFGNNLQKMNTTPLSQGPVPTAVPASQMSQQQSASSPSGGSASASGPSPSYSITLDESSKQFLSQFGDKLNNFGSYVQQLSSIHIPDKIQMTGTHTVDVKISGAAAIEALDERMKKLVYNAISEKMGKIWQQSGGQLGDSPSMPISKAASQA